MAKSSKKSAQTLRLQKELVSLMKEIDDEGLVFLIEQANIVKYNMRVDKINKERLQIDSGSKKNKKTKKPGESGDVEIIPGKENANFVVRLGVTRKFISREDFRCIVLIAQSTEDIRDAGLKIIRWMQKERSDILVDADIRNAANPLLVELIKQIKKRYVVKR